MTDEKNGRRAGLPLPADAPLLSLEDTAAYLRRSVPAVRKLLDGRANGDDGELGKALRRFVVRLSARRTYIAREPFLAWLEMKTCGVREVTPKIQQGVGARDLGATPTDGVAGGDTSVRQS